MVDLQLLKKADNEIYQTYLKELTRQQNNVELIASENFVSPAVMEAMGSFLTNKYAEGYPGKRYYGGCQCVDETETLAIERAKLLFNAEHANVQTHSGASANMATYFAFLKPGDTILGMNLAHGGHLTHGSPVNMSGSHYNIVAYGVRESDCTIDYEQVRQLAINSKPKLIMAGASAYPRIIDFAKFRQIADEVGAILVVDMAHIAGLVAAGLHPSPVPHADVVTSTTHKTLRGPRGGLILCKAQYAKAIDKAVFPGLQGGPLMHVIGAKAVCFGEALKPEFKKYQQSVLDNAKALSAALIKRGINIVSGGTDNHLMLVDLRNNNITGKELEHLLDLANITVNKNGIPFDTASPFITSGIRIGTPSVTTRGMTTADMATIGNVIADIVYNREAALEAAGKTILNLTAKYPLYVNDIN